MSTRPGPLEPWAIEQFYPELAGRPLTEAPFGPLKTPSRPNKRPHSATDTPFSPTKRRLLNDAGIYVPSKGALRATPHGSPAKKLDFGTPSSGAGLFAAQSKLAPSPRLLAFPDEDDSPFKAPLPPCDPVTPSSHCSVHYPGFVVHQDKHFPPPCRVSPSRIKYTDCKENDPPAHLLRESSVVFSADPKTAELQRKYMLKGDVLSVSPVASHVETPKNKSPRRAATSSKKKPRVQSVTPTEHRYNTRSSAKQGKKRLLEAKVDGADL